MRALLWCISAWELNSKRIGMELAASITAGYCNLGFGPGIDIFTAA